VRINPAEARRYQLAQACERREARVRDASVECAEAIFRASDARWRQRRANEEPRDGAMFMRQRKPRFCGAI